MRSNYILLSLLLLSAMLLSACDLIPQDQDNTTLILEPTSTSKIVNETPIMEVTPVKEPTVCTNNNDCEDGKLCINNQCGTIADIYITEGCDTKCNFNSVVIETSDKQTFTLNRGQGDYTAAGALEWTLMNGPDYCPGNDVIVPVRIKAKNYGKILSEEYVTVNVGESSREITHPQIKALKFTFKVNSVNEVCK